MPRNVHLTPFVIHPSDDLAKNNDLRNLSRNLATKYADGHIVTDDDLQIMGRRLWNSLSVQDDFDAAQKAAGDAILSVIIESDKPGVQAFPWETLYHPTHGFIGRNPAFTLTRRIAAGKPAQATLDKGPLRVLLFTSLPDNVDAERGRLNVEEEQAQVQEALLPWISQGVVQLEMPDDGRFSTLKDLLKRFDPHVLFLSGHGKFHHEPHADEAYGIFWFESETGDGEAIRDEEIARALVGTRVQAVILSACESGKAASDYLSNGLMQRISAAGIPHVIGMRESILDRAGIQFARALCDELAGRERLDVALQSARAAIQKAMDERGQWCLPMALSPNPQAQLIDWDFQPQAVEAQRLNQRVNSVSLPARFVGRRAEMRRYKIKLMQGALRSLLITGAGGMGKTSLACKLALDVQKARGDGLFAWSANSEKSWRDFELEMGQTLDKPRVERYDKFLPKAENEVARAKCMLDLLVEQFNGGVILFFDNLETLQDVDSLTVKDATVAAWMQAAHNTDGVTVFATSRWQIPDWDSEHLMLAHANYGDFLQIAAMKNLPIKRERMHRVYDALGGNIRGLEFFAAIAKGMDDENAEEAFLQTLEQTKSDLQANMAIAEIFKRLPDDAKKFLARLPAYHEAVPLEGLLKLGTDFPDTEMLLERLMAVSLLEASFEPHWNVTEYQCAPMVMDWMNENGLIDNSPEWLNVAADYHLYLHKHERDTLEQAIRAHHALRRAERHDEADRLTLDSIVTPMTSAGFYATLLDNWLPRICKSQDLKVRSKALNGMGVLGLHIGNYEMALSYLKQSLAVYQKIGDKAGEGTVLNNTSQVYEAQGDYETALVHLKQSLVIQQQIGNKEAEGKTLGNISQIYYAQGNYEISISYVEKALSIFQQIGDKAAEGAALDNISLINDARGDYDMALSYLKQSLTIYQQIGDIWGQSTTLQNMGMTYRLQGNYETALIYLKQSLAIQQQIGNMRGLAETLGNISQIYIAQGDYETSISYAQKALAIFQQIGNKAGEGTSLNDIATLYSIQNDYETALIYLKQSLNIFQQIGDKKGEGATLNNIAQIYDAQNDYEAALTYLEQSLDIRQQIGDKAGVGNSFNNISAIYQARGDYETALTYLKQSLDIRQQIGDRVGLCTTLYNMGYVHAQNNQMQEAFSAWVDSYLIAKQIGLAQALQAFTDLAPQLGLPAGLDGWEGLAQRIQKGEKIEFGEEGEVETLASISQTYADQGDYEKSLSYAEKVLSKCQQIGDKEGESTALYNISKIFKARGDIEKALIYLNRSLVISQQIGDKAGESIVLNNISQIYDAQGNYEIALTYKQQSLAISQQIGDKEREGMMLNNIGEIYRMQGDYVTALIYLRQALTIREQIDDNAGKGETINNIGLTIYEQGDVEAALPYLKQSLSLAQQIGNKYGEVRTLSNISNIYATQNNYEMALAYLEQALIISQQIGDQTGYCLILFNMAHNYWKSKQRDKAMSMWTDAYMLAKQIGNTQALQALSKLAPTLGLPEGLDGWEQLAHKVNVKDSNRK